MKKKEKIISFIFLALISIFFIMFYVVIHPIVLFDSDDWINCCSSRDAIPLYGAWNPGRILPEILMPLCTKIGAYLVWPLFKETSFFRVLTYVYAVSVTAAVMLVTCELYALIWTKTKKIHISVIGTLFFVLSIFWFFRSEYTENIYLLSTRDLSTYYVYVIPNLVCTASLIMLMRLGLEGKMKDMWRGPLGAARIVLIYFSIFSNIWASVILGIYVSLLLLRDIYKKANKKDEKVGLKSIIWKCIILAGWLLAQFMEATGGRASYSRHSLTYMERFGETLRYFADICLKVNVPCAVFIIACIIYLIVRIIKKDKASANILILCAINVIGLMMYNIVTCNKVEPIYIQRVDVLWGILIWIVLMEIYAVTSLCEQYPGVTVWMPLALILIFFNVDTKGKTFGEAIVGISEPEDAYMICEYIAQQFRDADAQGLTHMELVVPYYGSDDNWPIATYVNGPISDMVYEYGIVSHRIVIDRIVPTANLIIPQYE